MPEPRKSPVYHLRIPGAPRTKKTHSQIIRAGGRPRLIPSQQFSAWNRMAQIHLARLRALRPSGTFPVCDPVNVSARFYRDRDTGDLVNFMQALADALQEARIIENDSQIISWDGSRLDLDRESPRIEICIEVTPQ